MSEKRITVSLLSLVLLLLCLFSCGEKKESVPSDTVTKKNNETVTETEEDTSFTYQNELPIIGD